MQKRKISYRKLTTIAVFSALSTVLMYLQFGLPILPAHLAFDFSDLPAILAAFAYGPAAGVAVEFLKNLLHLLVGTTMGIGELSNFLHGVSFVLPAGLIYRIWRSKEGAFWGAMSGMLLMTLLSFPINYFVTIPMFVRVMGMPEQAILGMYQAILPEIHNFGEAILVFHMPLTLAKGVICVAISFLVYKRISPLLHGKN